MKLNPINYGVEPRKLLTARRAFLVAIAVIACGMIPLAPSTLWHFQAMHYHAACMNTRSDPNTIVYFEAPIDTKLKEAAVPESFSVKNSAGTCYGSFGPKAWQRYRTLLDIESGKNKAVVYVGPRRTPSGRLCLVALSVPIWGRDEQDFSVPWTASVISAGSFWQRPVVQTVGNSPDNALALPVEGADELVVYTGVADTLDPSRIVIKYRVNEKIGFIDAWLREDSTVRVVIRDGPGYSKH